MSSQVSSTEAHGHWNRHMHTTWRYELIYGDVVERFRGEWGRRNRRILRAALPTGRVRRADRRKITPLVKLGLCARNGRLTVAGAIKALEGLAIEHQCEVLGIPITRIGTTDSRNPEAVVADHLDNLGYKTWPLENRWFRELIGILLFPWSLKNDTSIGARVGVRPPDFVQTMFGREDELIAILQAAKVGTVTGNIRMRNEWVAKGLLTQGFDSQLITEIRYRYGYIGDELALFYRDLFIGLGKRTITDMFRRYCRDPMGLRSGWPDLVAVSGVARKNWWVHPLRMKGRVRLIEVKRMDSLSVNQMVTIHTMQDVRGLDIQVCKVETSRPVSERGPKSSPRSVGTKM